MDRSLYKLVPEKGSDLTEVEVKASNNTNVAHWANFLDCVKTRQKPNSDIEICQRSSTTCLLGNVALRSGIRIDWDEKKWTTVQPEARKFLSKEDRKPWRIKV